MADNTANQKALNMLGICRRAGKLALGHDATVDGITAGKALLVILAADASVRLKNEIRLTVERYDDKATVFECSSSMDELGAAVGKKSAVLAVTDAGLAKRITELFGEEHNIW